MRLTKSGTTDPASIDKLVVQLQQEARNTYPRHSIKLVNVSIAHTGYMGQIAVCCLLEGKA